uniref:Uteroglobin n=1 Tax=Equus asinus TaxID=9793 RepID=A0A9L0JQV2_EQUAS
QPRAYKKASQYAHLTQDHRIQRHGQSLTHEPPVHHETRHHRHPGHPGSLLQPCFCRNLPELCRHHSKPLPGHTCQFRGCSGTLQPDADMKAAATQLKTLVDLLPKNTKDSILKLMDKIAKSPLCA